MKVGVTKEKFIEKYSELLFMTREEISHLELQDDETVIIHYMPNYNYSTKVDIAGDSGIAIIRDIARQI